MGVVGRGGGGGGSHVVGLNFKTSRVGVYKCFTSLSKIERNFFVFVGNLEKRDGDALYKETITVVQFLSLYYYMENVCNLIGLEQWYFTLI